MEGNLFIWVCIGIGIMALIRELTKNKLVGVILRFCLGGALMIVMNCLVPQYTVSLNIYTASFATVLGVPGVMTMYVLRMIV